MNEAPTIKLGITRGLSKKEKKEEKLGVGSGVCTNFEELEIPS